MFSLPWEAIKMPEETVNRRRVFVIHGRNTKAKDAVCAFLSSLDLNVIGWEEAVHATGNSSPDTFDVVKKGLDLAHTVVVILTPDDIAQLNPNLKSPNENPAELEPTGQARQNVILEAGMALAMKRERTILLRLGNLREISDVKGINYISISNDKTSRANFRSRLKTTGCAIDEFGVTYLDAGNFDEAINPIQPSVSLVVAKSDSDIPEGIKTLERTFYTLESDWDSVKPLDIQNDHADVDKGKFVIKKMRSALSGHASDVRQVQSDTSTENFKTIVRNLNLLEDLQMYMDGGHSYRQFWQHGNQAFEDTRDLIKEIKEHYAA
jgi:predicted nucleotide-binding protein